MNDFIIAAMLRNGFRSSHDKTWHEKHTERRSFGQRLADSIAKGMGSWSFIIIQTLLVAAWMTLNIIAFKYHWDVYPFILLNLLFSTQAAYAAPIIMMSQNRQSDRDRVQAQADFDTNVAAKKEIESLIKKLDIIEVEKLDKIIEYLKPQYEITSTLPSSLAAKRLLKKNANRKTKV